MDQALVIKHLARLGSYNVSVAALADLAFEALTPSKLKAKRKQISVRFEAATASEFLEIDDGVVNFKGDLYAQSFLKYVVVGGDDDEEVEDDPLGLEGLPWTGVAADRSNDRSGPPGRACASGCVHGGDRLLAVRSPARAHGGRRHRF